MKTKYLLDTCICIHFLQNRQEIVEKIREVGWENCCIAEVTIGELLCGVRTDGHYARNIDVINSFVSNIEVVPTGTCIREFARQKRLLYSKGKPIEDFDILIGSASIAVNAVMVSENVDHIGRLDSIHIENWVIR